LEEVAIGRRRKKHEKADSILPLSPLSCDIPLSRRIWSAYMQAFLVFLRDAPFAKKLTYPNNRLPSPGNTTWGW